MLKHYFKITYRNLYKNKLFSLINICGLAIGIAVCTLVFQFVSYERSYDNFHGNANNIYRIRTDAYADGKLVDQYGATMQAVGEAIKDEIPEIIDAARIMSCSPMIIHNKKAPFYDKKIWAADPSFLTLFPLPMLRGDAKSALKEPKSVVITESTAKQLFGDEDPMGKHVYFGMAIDSFFLDYTIKGVIKDIPKNSHLEIDILISIDNLSWTVFRKPSDIKWYLPFFQTYVLLRPDSDVKALEAKFPQFLESHAGKIMEKFGQRKLYLQPLSDIHLQKGYKWALGGKGNRVAIIISFWGAVLILLFSLFNFINLSTVSSLNRAKEVSLRKAVGANPTQLTGQFFAESFLLTISASILALFIIYFSLPLFNRLSGMTLSYLMFTDPGFYPKFFLLIIAIVMLSGIFLTLILSSFSLVNLQEGKYGRYTRGISLRKVLIALQFVISILLIIGAFNINKQIKFMLNTDLGYSKDGILVLKAGVAQNYQMRFWPGVNNFKDELKKTAGVVEVAASSLHPGTYHGCHQEIRRPDGTREVHSEVVFIDNDFNNTFSIKLLAGRDFSSEFGADKDNLMINESLMKALGFASPAEAIGQTVILNDRLRFYIKPGRHKIIGVVSDYHHEPLMKAIKPTIFYYILAHKVSCYSIKFNDISDNGRMLSSIIGTYDKFFPNHPIEYYYLDEYIDNQYKADKNFEEILEITTLLGIIIAFLGLLGVSSYTSILRTKEIAVRKVLGASVAGIFSELSKGFLMLIIIATCIAVPISYYGLSKIFQNYAYRAGMSLWSFIVPSMAILIIAIFTLAYQVIKVSKVNPAESLKYE